MKPFVVIRVDHKLEAVGVMANDRKARLCYPNSTEECNYDNVASGVDMRHVPPKETCVMFADSAESAEALAELMSANYPMYSYLTARSDTVYYREMKPAIKAQFTKEGLLPV